MNIPLFPLSSIVMPGGLLPLRLFEPRYLEMVRDCFRQQSGFGVCLIKEGAEAGEAAQPFPYGTLVSIVDWDQNSDGLLNITVEGQQKFRVLATQVEKSGLLTGKVELLPKETSTSVSGEYKALQQTMHHLLEGVAPMIEYADPQLEDALWLGSRFTELLPLPNDVRHDLVAMDSPTDRLEAIAAMLNSISNRPD